MTKLDLGSVAFKVLAMVALIHGLNSSASLLRFLMVEYANEPVFVIAAALLPVILPALVGLLLWLFGDDIARNLWGAEKDIIRGSVSLEGVQAVSFSVVGLVILASAIPELANIALYYAFASGSVGADPASLSTRDSQIFIFAIKFAIGLWLFLGSSGLVAILRRLKQ